MEHVVIPVGEIHVPHNWVYANQAHRESAVITDASLLNRLALQEDTNSYWRLVNVSPAQWLPIISSNYVHDQSVASTTWTVTHNLGKYPSVFVQDNIGDVCEGEIDHVSTNQLTIEFSAALSGRAICN